MSRVRKAIFNNVAFLVRKMRKKLSAEQYHILREKGTEAPFSGKYDTFFEPGDYKCAACGNALFTTKTKYDSGCGWPAFFAANEGSIATKEDSSHGMCRIEAMCRKCGSHLGHVFDAIPPKRNAQSGESPICDGPKDKGGKRYCINSLALEFERK